MAARRFRPIRKRVLFSFDGEPFEAEEGEPIAASLLASGVAHWTRSPKYHRPRGPYCFARSCEGCLTRIGGEPNLFACHEPAKAELRVESQNHVGRKRADLLRLADWMFPDGVDHHDVFADLPLVPRILPSLARRIVGLGKLPAGTREREHPTSRRDADVVVVGSGPFGMAAALELASRGHTVEVKEMRRDVGGSARYDKPGFASLTHEFERAAKDGTIRVDPGTCVAGIYEREILCIGSARTELLRPELTVLATGSWESSTLFADNDTPGVMGVRAALELALLGIAAGEHIAALVTSGDGEDSARLAALLEGSGSRVEVIAGTPLRAMGRPVRSVRVRTDRGEREVVADAIAIDGIRAPAFTLAEQAGCTLARTDGGFAVDDLAQPGGFDSRFVCVGEVTGPRRVTETDARTAAGSIAARGGATRRSRAT